MTHESSNAQKLDNPEDCVLRTRELFQKLQAIDPTKVRCMMGMVVAESPDNKGENVIYAFVLGSDEEIVNMFASLVTITHKNIAQANASPTHNDEVKH